MNRKLMKITLSDIIKSSDAMNMMVSAKVKHAPTAYAIQKNYQVAARALEPFDKTRSKLMNEVAGEVEKPKENDEEDKKRYQKQVDEKSAQILAQLDEILKDTVEIDIRLIDLEKLLEYVDLTPNHLISIDWMINEMDESPQKVVDNVDS